jgi:hypothetical protein
VSPLAPRPLLRIEREGGLVHPALHGRAAAPFLSSCSGLPLQRSAGTGRPRPSIARRENVSAHTLAALAGAASRDDVHDRCQAHRCAGGRLRTTRITLTELAARNRFTVFQLRLALASL